MGFNFLDLNDNIRNAMLEEVNLDISSNTLYYSKRFNQHGIDSYPNILIESIKGGNEQTLANAIRKDHMFNASSVDKNGRASKTPSNAHETLAEGEFNRFYIRALARIAINENKELEVYRAKEVSNARSESIQKIGITVNPNDLLADLRKNIGIDTFLGLPGGVNSGLSVKLV
ncbi:hypothetical protein [Acinetobacter baumannii]|uniref:Uncharacterized protein n=1 Tax=Acinetobacter baumannii TaxID=470 RepID=A0A241ZFJ5_ACIBA|nr:hypothetical protein [Acinetobacter baumannii]OTM89967.1 hypothetical protein B9X95_07040 [Acinetobacter baumannii]